MDDLRGHPRKRANDVHLTDADLLRKASRGDEKAYYELVERHAPRLYRVALSLVGNTTDAEDVLQETFAGAFRHAARYRGLASVNTWLTQILVRQAARSHRTRMGRRAVSLESRPETQRDPARTNGVTSAASTADTRMDIADAIQALPPIHREVIVLREMQGLSYEEIAHILGVPRGTVESRLFRARQELKDRLKDYLP